MKKYIHTRQITFINATAVIVLTLACIGCSNIIAPGNPLLRPSMGRDIVSEGLPQELFVLLDSRSITEKEKERRKAKGIRFNDHEINEETKRELDALKAAVFPNGRLGDAYVTGDFSQMPMVKVYVPDRRAREQLLSHPRVKAVYENQESSLDVLPK